MTPEAQTQKYFLGGTIVMGVLILLGLIWAIFFMKPDQSVPSASTTNVQFSDANDPAWGPSDAKVVVRLFEDFQCPACAAAAAGVAYARRTYGDRVRFVWNDFPLTQIHANARGAAHAARCAEEQGKFWEYHDALYAKQLEWSRHPNPMEIWTRLAEEVGLKTEVFTSCQREQKYQQKIVDDIAEAGRASVESTPTAFINSKRVIGSMSPADWDRELLPLL